MKGYGEYDFDDVDFVGLHLDVYGKGKDDNPIAEYPVLSLYPEFRKVNKVPGIKGMVLLKFIVFMYDFNSPLKDKISEVRLRKVHAMALAGIEVPKEGVYSEEVNSILKNENEDVIRMVFRYARMHRGSRYAYLTSLQEGLHMAEEKIASGELKGLEDMRKVSQESERVALDLTGGDGINRLTDNFLDYVEMESLGISPEDIAAAIHAGEDPVAGVDIYDRVSSGGEKTERLTAIEKKHQEKVAAKYGRE